jgi:hypothetical protein
MKAFDFDARSFDLLNDALPLILLPKNGDAANMSDYLPISLIHIIGKLLPIVLASCLALHLSKLISVNQSGFIKGRYIQDNFSMVQSSVKLLHVTRNRPCSSRSTFLFDILKHVGFSAAWLDWIAVLLSAANTQVLLNGMLGRQICHARGLWRPFVAHAFPPFVMEVLNSLIRKADDWSLQ